jgi:hypothetical protein
VHVRFKCVCLRRAINVHHDTRADTSYRLPDADASTGASRPEDCFMKASIDPFFFFFLPFHVLLQVQLEVQLEVVLRLLNR